MELNELRQQVDAIDRDLIELFKARMQVLARIAKYKKENRIELCELSKAENKSA